MPADSHQVPAGHLEPWGTSGSSQVVPWVEGDTMAQGCPWAHRNWWYCKWFLSCNL